VLGAEFGLNRKRVFRLAIGWLIWVLTGPPFQRENGLMRAIALSLLLPIPILAHASESRVDGWKAAKLGMTEQEVRDAFKGEIKEFDKPEKWKTGTAPIYVTVELFSEDRREKIRMENKPWNASFVFDPESKMLAEIILKPDRSAKVSDFEFTELERQLTDKYGQPDTKTDNRQNSPATGKVDSRDRTRSWNRAPTRIELRYSELYWAGVRNLTVAYSKIPKGGNNNL
jgi:hypothetical protein